MLVIWNRPHARPILKLLARLLPELYSTWSSYYFLNTPYTGLYGEAPPERGTFFRLLVYKRVGISQVAVYKRVAKSVVSQREVNN